MQTHINLLSLYISHQIYSFTCNPLLSTSYLELQDSLLHFVNYTVIIITISILEFNSQEADTYNIEPLTNLPTIRLKAKYSKQVTSPYHSSISMYCDHDPYYVNI